MAFLPTFRLSTQAGDRSPSRAGSAKERPPSRAPSRTAGPEVTRIDIYPDYTVYSGNDSEQQWRTSGDLDPGAVLNSKPPTSSNNRAPDVQNNRRSSTYRNSGGRNRTSAFSYAVGPSRSPDHKGQTKRKETNDYPTNLPDGTDNDYNDRDDEESGVYCVIRSGAGGRNGDSGKVSQWQGPGLLTRHQFKQVCGSRPHQAVVFSADTASLLLQSGPPLLIRSAGGDASYQHRTAARSAIQRVCDANFFSEIQLAPRSKSGVEGNTRRQQDVRRARLAFGRSGSGNLDKKHFLKSRPSNEKTTSPDKFIDKQLQRSTSEDTLSRAPASQTSEIKKKRLDSKQTVSRESTATGSKQGNLCNKQQTSDNSRHLQSWSSEINTNTAVATGNMAARQHAKIRPLEVGNNHKTLTPSKHGFHPRSQSPTFKRLVAASEMLKEIHASANGHSSLADVSVSSGGGASGSCPLEHGSSSSESTRDFRSRSKNIIEGALDESSDDRSNDSNSKKPDLSPRRERARRSTNTNDPPYREVVRVARALRRKTENIALRKRHDVSHDRNNHMKHSVSDNSLVSRAGPVNAQKDMPTSHISRNFSCGGDPEEGQGEIQPNPRSEGCVETGPRFGDGQPKQLHFFLPQLAAAPPMGDGIGSEEVTRRSPSGRCQYREARLELLDRREATPAGDGGLHHRSSISGQPGEERFYYDTHNDDDDPTTTTIITEIQPSYKHLPNGVKNYANRHRNDQRNLPFSDVHPNSKDQPSYQRPSLNNRAGSKERVTACDIKSGHLTLNVGRQSPPGKEDNRQKRHVSPLRNVNNQKPEKAGRGRRVSTSPFRAPIYLESQLPSEKLKKQLEDFPTLVSMEYSDPDPLLQMQVR